MLEKAIKRMNEEHPNFIIYTASIWIDKDAKVSAISFDSKENALQKIVQTANIDKEKFELGINSNSDWYDNRGA
ncbi:hypothetical protein [Sphingobacterium sp. GVS05A]|uniref:hypothetical protein n=1 Tax=Sphingobacterium TaxID=28453 RepID=UPI001CBB7873|nr:hypothetical protein [Sphingobacterium sp. GVS05A]